MATTYMPRDRTKREHVGFLDKVIWYDTEKPVSILALTDGSKVIIDMPAGNFMRGQKYRFMGRWEEGNRGPQFTASTYVHDEPHSRDAMLRYLSSVCSNVGDRTAERLWLEFGSSATTTLRNEPEKVVAAGIMSEDAAREASRDLERFAATERTRVDLFGLFGGRGFPRKLVEHSISRWGARAPEIIQADPFRLLTARLPGCGFKRCDKLYLDLGKRADALKRQALAGWNALREDRTGSTWLPAGVVVTAIKDAVPGCDDPVKALKLGIRGGLFRIYRDGMNRWVAVANHAQAEQRIVDSLARLRKAQPAWPTDLPTSVTDGDGLPSEHQVRELLSATTSPVGAFTGGPGTGKTHSLSFLLRLVVSRFGEASVAVAAPTGKAAVRATESLLARGLGIRATTIHQLLEIGRNGHDGQGWGFNRNRSNPLPQRFLIVDESSMIDTGLMADLLDACAIGTQVLLVGDPFQLPPVGHGAPLRDILAAGVSQGELTEVRRNAGLIVRACAAIKSGSRPSTADRFDLDADNPANLRFMECPSEQILDQIEDVLLAFKKFDPVRDAQILVATNEKSGVSRKAVNERLGRVLNPDGRRERGVPFAVGDKVICTTNSKLRNATPVGKFRDPKMAEDTGYYQVLNDSESYVANGEIGYVLAVGQGGMVVMLGTKIVWVAKSKPRAEDSDSDGASAPTGGMGDWEPAWAITGHKSQGSEWPVVIVVADKGGASVADRNWWYTTISRASKACLIVGDRAAFDAQCRRQSLTHRKTFLVESVRALESATTSTSEPDPQLS